MNHHSNPPDPGWALPALMLALALTVASANAAPRTSTSYSIPAETIDLGGKRTTSGDYTHDGSLGGIVGISTVAAPAEVVKAGYVGQLYELVSVDLTAASPTVPETGTVQLTANFIVLDDGSLLPIDTNSVSWSVALGPLAGIDAAGLATADVVYQDTLATAQGSFEGTTGTVDVTVLDTEPDNFGGYAGDKLPDIWQVTHFGNPPNPDAAPLANPEGDLFNNLFEFGSGTDPNASTGPLTADVGAGTFTPGGPVIHVEFNPLRVTYRFVRYVDFAGVPLTYTPTFSHGMVVFDPSTDTPVVLIPDPGTGYELVEVPFPLFLPNGEKARFSQLEIALP